MKKILRISKSIIFLLAAIAGITTLVLQFKKENPELDIKTISKERLTKIPNENGFEASYLFNNIPVENLWRINVLIENTGAVNLIGKGSRKQLIGEKLVGKFDNVETIISHEVLDSNFPFYLTTDQNQEIHIDFQQWKINEFVEIVFYLELASDSSRNTDFRISDRQIIDGQVTYSSIRNEEVVEKPIIDSFPNYLSLPIKWSLVTSIFLFSILLIIVAIQQTMKLLNFKKWKLKNSEEYYNFLLEYIAENGSIEYTEPEKLPKHVWKEYPGEKPDLPDYINSFFGSTIFILIMLLIALSPLLWIIKN